MQDTKDQMRLVADALGPPTEQQLEDMDVELDDIPNKNQRRLGFTRVR